MAGSPTHPKLGEDFIGSDEADDVVGHVSPREGDGDAQGFMAMATGDDVEGHIQARAVPDGDDTPGFRAAFAHEDEASGLRSLVTGDDEDVEGHVRGLAMPGDADTDGIRTRDVDADGIRTRDIDADGVRSRD